MMKSFLKKYFDQGHQERRQKGRPEGEIRLLVKNEPLFLD
jgi:hypothetical protein